MKKTVLLVMALTPLALVSCSPSADESPAPEAADAQDPPTPAEPEIALSELAQKGKRLYLRCRSCHTVEKDGIHLTGPNLHGLIDARAGVKPGYAFSEALVSSDLTWDRQSLDQWIENPIALVPGNKMAFVGLSKKEERDALIAYLEEVTR